MMNHKQCIAIIALIALIAGGFLYKHHMICKQDDVQIQGGGTCSKTPVTVNGRIVYKTTCLPCEDGICPE